MEHLSKDHHPNRFNKQTTIRNSLKKSFLPKRKKNRDFPLRPQTRDELLSRIKSVECGTIICAKRSYENVLTISFHTTDSCSIPDMLSSIGVAYILDGIFPALAHEINKNGIGGQVYE